MPSCNNCGGEIEFRYVDGRCIPFYLDGQSCFGRSGGYGTYSSLRSTGDGESFEFPFITYPSYVNPNARCPVCGCAVYFYQSPYGGRVFFDELGPPWTKHPCTDNPVVRHYFSSAEGRARFLISSKIESAASDSPTGERKEPTVAPARLVTWVSEGWMPFIVSQIVNRRIGIEAEGKLFVSAGGEPLTFRIIQNSADSRFYHAQGQLRIGFSLIQNTSLILTALNECPILLKKDPDLEHLTLSSFILTREGDVEEITLSVVGIEIGQT